MRRGIISGSFNLIGLIGLRKEIVAETEKYFEYEQPVELVTNIEG